MAHIGSMVVTRNYRVEIIYTTKRNTVCVGMTLDARSPGDAIDISLPRVLKGYPARQLNSASVTPQAKAEGRAP